MSLPGGLAVSEKLFGFKQVISMVLKVAWAYRRTMIFLLKKRGIKATLNFLYVKAFVPVGEGAGGGAMFFLGPLVRRFPQLAPYPYNIEIEVTTVCNRKCIICEHTYWQEESRHLSFEEFKHIVDQFPRLKWTNLTGEGSSFLNKDYIKMIRYLKSKDVPVFLVDHFNDMNEELAKELIEIGVDGIYISIDGATKETYEKIRVGCDFDRVVDNIRKFVEMKQKMRSPIPELCFRFIVTSLNVHEMPEFIELVRSFGDRRALGDGSKVEFCGLLEFDEIRHLNVPKVPEKIVRATAIKAKRLDVHVMFGHGLAGLEENPPMKNCLAWMEPYIMMGGYVQPCCAVLMSNRRDFLRKHSFGNLFEKPFKDIWFSERYKKFRQMVPKENEKVPILCSGCRAYDSTVREHLWGVDTAT